MWKGAPTKRPSIFIRRLTGTPLHLLLQVPSRLFRPSVIVEIDYLLLELQQPSFRLIFTVTEPQLLTHEATNPVATLFMTCLSSKQEKAFVR